MKLMRTKWVYLTLGFFIGELVLITFVDRPLSEFLRALDQKHPALINIFRDYTDFGKSKWYLWPSAISIALSALVIRLSPPFYKHRFSLQYWEERLLFIFLSISLSGLITDVIKPLLGHARPVLLAQKGFYGFSPFSFEARLNGMPSGHATTAVALGFALSYVWPRGRFLWWSFALLLALSRVMINAHYVSDILAGSMVAFLTYTTLRTRSAQNGIILFNRRIFPIDGKKSPR